MSLDFAGIYTAVDVLDRAEISRTTVLALFFLAFYRQWLIFPNDESCPWDTLCQFIRWPHYSYFASHHILRLSLSIRDRLQHGSQEGEEPENQTFNEEKRPEHQTHSSDHSTLSRSGTSLGSSRTKETEKAKPPRDKEILGEKDKEKRAQSRDTYR